MNKVDHVVTKVLSAPILKYGAWFLLVEAVAWGRLGTHELMFPSKAVAVKVVEGYKFLA